MTNQETKRIEAYSIADFVKQIQEAVLEGYRINLEDNDKYPLQIGMGFYATLDLSNPTLDKVDVMTKTTKGVTVENISQVIEDLSVKLQDGKDVIKRGRQPKV
jgi:hypothetical protein